MKYVQRVLPKLHAKRGIIRKITLTYGTLRKTWQSCCMLGAKMAATIYVAPRFLAFLSLFIVVCSPLYVQPLSNGSIFPVWSLVRTGLNFPSPFGLFYRSSKGMPRRPVSSWRKRDYVCIHLPRKDLTIFNDIEKNPGPPLIINNKQVSRLTAFTVAHRSFQSLLVSPSTSHLRLHFVRYASMSYLLQERFAQNSLQRWRFETELWITGATKKCLLTQISRKTVW